MYLIEVPTVSFHMLHFPSCKFRYPLKEFSYSTVQHLDIIKVLFYSPTDAQMSCLKKTTLKFTLKQLRNVSL